MTLERFYKSPPTAKHLAWALPIAVLIAATVWWFLAGLWTWGDAFRQPRSYIIHAYWTALPSYATGALIGSIPLLLANWSRRVWPRLVLIASLLLVQMGTATLFMLLPRSG